MKKIKVFCCFMLLMLAAVFPVSAAQVDLYAETPDEVSPGKAFDVIICFSSEKAVGAAHLSLVYDKDLLKAGTTKLENKSMDDYFRYSDSDGIIEMICMNKPAGAREYKVRQHFIPLSEGAEKYSLTASLEELTDSGGARMDISDIGPVVSVVAVSDVKTEESGKESSSVREASKKAKAESSAAARKESSSAKKKESSAQKDNEVSAPETASEGSVTEYSLAPLEDRTDNSGNRYLMAAGFVVLVVGCAAGAYIIGRKRGNDSPDNDGKPEQSCTEKNAAPETVNENKEKTGK